MGTGEDGFRFGERVETVTEATKPIEEAQPRRFCRYPAYKDSGIEWLGAIPANWGVRRLTDVANLVNGFPFDSKLFDRSHGIPLVRIRDLFNTTTEVNWSGDPVSEAGIRDGDILIGMDGDFSVAWWAQGPALLNQRLCCLRARSVYISQRYIFYCLPFPLKALNDVTYATTVKHLSSLDVLKFRLPIPSHNEQRGIAAFLDRETARIDGLVERKERLIELIQEKRRALIARAVTRGLDRNVPMKDSGVAWLGKIPAHWGVKRLWHLTPTERQIMYGIVLPGPNVEVGVPIVKGGDVIATRLKLGSLNKTTFEIESRYARSRLQGGDLVYAIRGSIGEVELVPDELEGANLTQDAARVAYTKATNGSWLLYALRSNVVFSQLDAGALGATIKGINIRDLKRALVPVPPKSEQIEIANFLNAEVGRFEKLLSKILAAINHLTEFRIALISAAVTGKIDVRGEVS